MCRDPHSPLHGRGTEPVSRGFASSYSRVYGTRLQSCGRKGGCWRSTVLVQHLPHHSQASL